MDERYVLNGKFFFRRLGKECFLLNLETDEYFTLNETGGTILETMREPHSLEGVQAALAAKFDAPDRDALREDVEAFFLELHERAILIGEKG